MLNTLFTYSDLAYSNIADFRPDIVTILSSIHVQLQQTSYGSHNAQSLFMQPRRFIPAFSHHHQDLIPPRSPLNTRHMHSPSSHHHNWANGDTSSDSAGEKQHKATPQTKPPMLPPKHSHGAHGHKYLPQVSNDLPESGCMLLCSECMHGYCVLCTRVA